GALRPGRGARPTGKRSRGTGSGPSRTGWGRRDPFPKGARRTTRAVMEPSRRGTAHACRVVVSTPTSPVRTAPRLSAPWNYRRRGSRGGGAGSRRGGRGGASGRRDRCRLRGRYGNVARVR